MAFRIRKKRKDIQKAARQGKDVDLRNDKEKLQELAEWDAIAESSREHHGGESNLDSSDGE